MFDYEGGVSHEANKQQALEKEALEMQKEQVRNRLFRTEVISSVVCFQLMECTKTVN